MSDVINPYESIVL